MDLPGTRCGPLPQIDLTASGLRAPDRAGDKLGQPLFRLNEAWRVLLRTAGLLEIPVKALRHSFSTHSVGIIAPEHRAQLMGHQGPHDGTVYRHRHGPGLARAAALVERHLLGLLGDLP